MSTICVNEYADHRLPKRGTDVFIVGGSYHLALIVIGLFKLHKVKDCREISAFLVDCQALLGIL
ncbi:MAG: hypothetical protein ACPLM9_08090 [Methanomassiliicoccales archaeon]